LLTFIIFRTYLWPNFFGFVHETLLGVPQEFCKGEMFPWPN